MDYSLVLQIKIMVEIKFKVGLVSFSGFGVCCTIGGNGGLSLLATTEQEAQASRGETAAKSTS